MKGACGPLAGDTSRIGVKRQIGFRNLWENAKRQVWNTILKREAAAMGHIHVCDACVAPCDDPESQMVVTIYICTCVHNACTVIQVHEYFVGQSSSGLMHHLSYKTHTRDLMTPCKWLDHIIYVAHQGKEHLQKPHLRTW